MKCDKKTLDSTLYRYVWKKEEQRGLMGSLERYKSTGEKWCHENTYRSFWYIHFPVHHKDVEQQFTGATMLRLSQAIRVLSMDSTLRLNIIVEYLRSRSCAVNFSLVNARAFCCKGRRPGVATMFWHPQKFATINLKEE